MSGREEGQALEEIIIEPPEIKMIRTDHTSLVPVGENRKAEKPITGREYRRMLRKAWFAFGVSFGINILLTVAVYVLQAGPI